MAKAKRSRRGRAMSPVHAHAAAIDIGATLNVAAVGPDRDPEPVHSVGTFTADLHRMADWFARCGIERWRWRATGVYWIPAYEVLEQRGFAMVLVNARDAKHVPGRKTDVSDAEWLRRLHEYGLLRGSFRPEAKIAVLRDYLRQRERLLDYAASHIQHMQKALTQMNLQLHHVVADITGATGLRIIRAIVTGERDPATLAALRDHRCRAPEETIRKALAGNDREEHVFALAQALELYDAYQAKVAACDARIEAVLERGYRPSAPRRRRRCPRPGAGRGRPTSSPSGTRGLAPDPGCGPDPDPRPRAVSRAQAGGRVRHKPFGLAQRQVLHLVAVPRTEQQDLRRQGAVVENSAHRQLGRGFAPARRRDGRTHRQRPGCVLPPLVRARRKGQGGHRHSAQDRGAILNTAARADQPPAPGEVAGLRAAGIRPHPGRRGSFLGNRQPCPSVSPPSHPAHGRRSQSQPDAVDMRANVPPQSCSPAPSSRSCLIRRELVGHVPGACNTFLCEGRARSA